MRNRLINAIHVVASNRHKLVILLGGFGAGKTDLLKDMAPQVEGEYVNLNLYLTERLLTLPHSQYADGVTIHRLIDELCDELSPDHRPLLIDNVEILFSPELGRVNPVDTFKRISRQVRSCWPCRPGGRVLAPSTAHSGAETTCPYPWRTIP